MPTVNNKNGTGVTRNGQGPTESQVNACNTCSCRPAHDYFPLLQSGPHPIRSGRGGGGPLPKTASVGWESSLHSESHC